MTWLSAIFFFFLIFGHYCQEEKVVIDTKLGKIIGNVQNKQSPKQKVYEFLAIQYGIAPIANLRFRPSILNESWGNSTYNGTTFGKKCIQSFQPHSAMSENCLFLNIWTPNLSNKKLPVIVFIHGGGFIFGSGADSQYNGNNFVSMATDIVYVTINYRLGALGFLASEQLYNEDKDNWPSTGGLNGIYDQIQAITWVKKYISDFGGDPDHITISGESAGGISVCMLAVSPMVPHNLFQRAIIESGSCFGPVRPQVMARGLYLANKLLESHGMTNNITQLRLLPATDFAMSDWNEVSIDGLILTQQPVDIYNNLNVEGNNLNVDSILNGFNSMDGVAFISRGKTPNNEQEYTRFLNEYISNETQVNLIETIYYPLSDYPKYAKYSNASLAWYTINGDCCFGCSALYQMINITKQMNHTKFYGYVYEFRGGGYPYYAPHGSEMPFVYDHATERVYEGIVPWNQSLSDSMLISWSNYVSYGFPNITNNMDNIYIEWNKFEYQSGDVMIFDDKMRIEHNFAIQFRHNACQFWYEEVGYETMVKLCDMNPNPYKVNKT